jgi:predicted phosphodiesterase
MKKWIWLMLLIGIVALAVIYWPKKELIVPGKTVVEVVKPFKFAVMADVHNDNEELGKALRQAQGDGEELVIVAGDLTNNGSEKELEAVKKTLDDSQEKYLAVPGNHDVIKKQFGAVFGNSYQTYVKDNLKMILIDNSYWAGLGEEQKQWIENESQGCNVIVCVAVMHMPLEHSLTDHVMGEGNKIGTEDAAWLHKILVENNIKSIYAGHLHYASTYTMDNLTTNLVGAISSTRNNQTPRMMEVEFDGKALVNRMVEIE